jgi:hypothetical protein
MACMSVVGCSTFSDKQKVLEYQVNTVFVERPAPLKQFQEYLNNKAKEGWHLVGFNEGDSYFNVVLSRPKSK